MSAGGRGGRGLDISVHKVSASVSEEVSSGHTSKGRREAKVVKLDELGNKILDSFGNAVFEDVKRNKKGNVSPAIENSSFSQNDRVSEIDVGVLQVEVVTNKESEDNVEIALILEDTGIKYKLRFLYFV